MVKDLNYINKKKYYYLILTIMTIIILFIAIFMQKWSISVKLFDTILSLF